MQITKLLCLVLLIIPLISCSKDKINKSVIKEKDLESQVLEAYKEGLKSLKEGDVIFASKKLMKQKLCSPNQNGHQVIINGRIFLLLSRLLWGLNLRIREIYKNLSISWKYRLCILFIGIMLVWTNNWRKKDLQTIIKAKENFLF